MTDLEIEQLLKDKSWGQSDIHTFSNGITFDCVPQDYNTYMMFTMGRCGTKFSESILQKKYKMLAHHYTLDHNVVSMLKSCAPDNILMCFQYRSDWWAWAVSGAIARQHGHYHYNTYTDYSDKAPVVLDKNYLKFFENWMITLWNFWCNIRVLYPTKEIKLMEYSSIIPANQSKTNHTRIPYDPSKLIVDYDKSKEYFDREMLPHWKMLEERFLNHLSSMKVNITTEI